MVVDGSWLAWPLLSGWKSDSCDIGWAEFIALELCLLALVKAGFHNVTIIIHSDNSSVVGSFRAGSSCSIEQNFVLRRIILLLHEHHIRLQLKWVPSKLNLANAPSHGIFPSSPLFSHPPKVPLFLPLL
jgi:hypothetical protein